MALRRSKSDTGGGGPTRVVVVNDDRDACELIARIVESAGYEAVRAHSEDEALNALEGDQPANAALVDFTSGGTTAGLKLLDAIRRTPPIAGVPVVLLTQNAANRIFAWESGADGFLIRPFHADDVTNELRAVLARSPEEREAVREQQLAEG